ncbi:MAG: cytochrome c3 family protein [Myxococcota bacterium]
MAMTLRLRPVLACIASLGALLATMQETARSAPPGRFPHAAHATTSCEACHSAALTSTQATDDLRPAVDACTGCHAVAPATMLVRRPKTKARRASPKDRRFNHAAHSKNPATPCASCHAADHDGEPGFPKASDCASCHAGATIPWDALAASTKDPKTEQTTAPLLPSNHNVDWLARHGHVARAQADDCTNCHTPPQCNDCHLTRGARILSAHPPNFVFIHTFAARADSASCTECHNQQTFCTSCHIRTKSVARPPNAPPARLQFHPPGFLDANTPGNHGVLAKRNINDCASCHTESDCVSCHQGINPHPANFSEQCGRWLRANPLPCTKCHLDVSALQMRCR